MVAGEKRRGAEILVITIGIDPGKGGAAALMLDGQYVDYVDWSDGPTVRKKFGEWVLFYDIRLVVLQRVHAMPKQGVSSSFSFGDNYGWWKGLLDGLGLPWMEILPQRWMRGLVPKKKSKTDKPGLPVARRMFPSAPLSRVKDNGRADAMLIGYWAFQHVKGE